MQDLTVNNDKKGGEEQYHDGLRWKGEKKTNVTMAKSYCEYDTHVL